jgi:hypothetical protein
MWTTRNTRGESVSGSCGERGIAGRDDEEKDGTGEQAEGVCTRK